MNRPRLGLLGTKRPRFLNPIVSQTDCNRMEECADSEEQMEFRIHPPLEFREVPRGDLLHQCQAE